MANETEIAAGVTEESVRKALATVHDPEINRPITEIGMVKSVEIAEGGAVKVGVYLTVSGCPMRETITNRVTEAVAKVPGVTGVEVELDVMSDEQRKELSTLLRGGAPAGESELLVTAVRDAEWPEGRVQVFAHGERGYMKGLRDVFYVQRGLERAQVSLSGYWAKGRVEDDFQAEKKLPIGKI